MLEALGLGSIEPLLYSPEIRKMDLAMLVTEAEQLLPHRPEWLAEIGVPAAPTGPITPWDHAHAKRQFEVTFQCYFGGAL